LLLKVKPEKAAERLEDEREEYNSETIYKCVIDVRFFFNGSTAPWGPRTPHFSRLHDHTLLIIRFSQLSVDLCRTITADNRDYPVVETKFRQK
jgi:hypothetical protein